MNSQSPRFGFFGEVAREKEEKALHLGVESLPGGRILDRCDEMRELIFHRLRCNTASGGLEVEVRSTSDAMSG